MLTQSHEGKTKGTPPTPHHPLQGWKERNACCQGKNAKAETQIILPRFTQVLHLHFPEDRAYKRSRKRPIIRNSLSYRNQKSEESDSLPLPGAVPSWVSLGLSWKLQSETPCRRLARSLRFYQYQVFRTLNSRIWKL